MKTGDARDPANACETGEIDVVVLVSQGCSDRCLADPGPEIRRVGALTRSDVCRRRVLVVSRQLNARRSAPVSSNRSGGRLLEIRRGCSWRWDRRDAARDSGSSRPTGVTPPSGTKSAGAFAGRSICRHSSRKNSGGSPGGAGLLRQHCAPRHDGHKHQRAGRSVHAASKSLRIIRPTRFVESSFRLRAASAAASPAGRADRSSSTTFAAARRGCAPSSPASAGRSPSPPHGTPSSRQSS